MIHKCVIPDYVANWTDKYFHQSAFDVPFRYPNEKVINFLMQFRKKETVTLYRGINYYNETNNLVTSWTYDLNVAKSYANEIRGRIVDREFVPDNILLDTTILTPEQKKILGYDYEIDDKEVLILER